MESLLYYIKRTGYLFYIINPKETFREDVGDVPDYIKAVVPCFIGMIILEQLIAWLKGYRTMRLNDTIGSLSQGVSQELTKVFSRGALLFVYVWVYENWRIVTLPWNSAWTWWICFLGVEFSYYWMHRACHEVNILWAAHQVHHSSEDYNLGTALRQSAIQRYVTSLFYTPMALAIPPSVLLVHHQLNTLAQFWFLTEVVHKLGLLEYILNTPSHHRVHHGRNKYCIDKNYGGILIIWDRMFGTFQAEDEKVVYGLTHPINTFQSIPIQLGHYIHIWKTFWATSGVGNKLSVLLKGPGWEPGKPRLGLPEDIPEVSSTDDRYNPHLPLWCNIYVFIHFLIVGAGYLEIMHRHANINYTVSVCAVFYLMFSLNTVGHLLDGSTHTNWWECARCLLYFVADYYFIQPVHIGAWYFPGFYALRGLFLASALFWAVRSMTAAGGNLNFIKKLT